MVNRKELVILERLALKPVAVLVSHYEIYTQFKENYYNINEHSSLLTEIFLYRNERLLSMARIAWLRMLWWGVETIKHSHDPS